MGTYRVRRVEHKGSEVFVEAEFSSDALGTFAHGWWLTPSEIATIDSDAEAVNTIIAVRLPAILAWRGRVKQAEEAAAERPILDGVM